MESTGRYFVPYACCVPVRGARRSALFDLQRQTMHFVPNDLHDLLTATHGVDVAAVRAGLDDDDAQTLGEYLAFLESEDLGFFTDEPALFPSLDLTWDAPETITNAVIDVDASSRHDFPDLVAQLEELGCKALELRFFRPAGIHELDGILKATAGTRLHSVSLLLPETPELTDQALETLCLAHQRLTQIQLHSAAAAASTRVVDGHVPVLRHVAPVTSAACCGQISLRSFAVNVRAFTEAQRHNSCLNRKVGIDAGGQIRNCPALRRSFGDAGQTRLADAVRQPAFQQAWSVAKDQIDTCRVCEFRYVCTDCRAFTEGGAVLGKPAKCNYDPYTATWRS